jgi:hypothetical protein
VSRGTGKPTRRVEVLRKRGVRGGRIAPHRAMIRLEMSKWLLVDLLVLPAMFATGMFVALDWLLAGWRMLFERLQRPLDLGLVATRVDELVPNLFVPIPYFDTAATWPTTNQMLGGWIVMVLLAVTGMLMRGRAIPLGYLFRGIAIVQLSAQVWFTLAEPPFPYSPAVYISGLLLCGIVILLLAPFLVALTFFIFDFPLWQKMLLATLLLAHLAVMIPLQAVVHAYIIDRASLLALPVLFLVFGVLLDVFVYVALYGWGMSWRSGGALDWSDRRAPRAPETPPQGVEMVA